MKMKWTSYYAMRTVRLPASIIEEMEKIIRRFFWGDSHEKRKMHWISWAQVCLPKDRGGLGIKSLRDMNTAMLAKLGWLILTRPDELWVQVLRNKYGHLLSSTPRRNTSALWRHIRATIPLITSCSEMISPTGDPPFSSEFRWKATTAGNFTVASAYEELTNPDNLPHDPAWSRLWSMKGPSRLNFLLWQVYRQLLPTAYFLHRRHMQQDGSCSICQHQLEDTLHALRNCHWARAIWEQLV